ncbi:hypothetical protein GBF38_003326 [Nibea albiflora]|uniref:Uncharacterized protein n=1 Tax=Nibea albiflora TaxID=240163 RepID=A0ACB7FKQ8_NIBAL|nr:hypothetical protein GBF38_003326 [Nibea albiflora]
MAEPQLGATLQVSRPKSTRHKVSVLRRDKRAAAGVWTEVNSPSRRSYEPFAEETPQVLKEAEDIIRCCRLVRRAEETFQVLLSTLIRSYCIEPFAEETPQMLKEAEDIIRCCRLVRRAEETFQVLLSTLTCSYCIEPFAEETPQMLKEAEDIIRCCRLV